MIIKIKNYSKQIVSIILLILIFLINLSIEYNKYLDFIDEEIYETNVEVLNIYEKPTYNILRLKAQNFDFFANIDKSEDIKKFDVLNMTIAVRYCLKCMYSLKAFFSIFSPYYRLLFPYSSAVVKM